MPSIYIYAGMIEERVEKLQGVLIYASENNEIERTSNAIPIQAA